MKTYQLHPKTDDILKRFPALCKRLEGAERTPEAAGAPRVLCLGMRRGPSVHMCRKTEV